MTSGIKFAAAIELTQQFVLQLQNNELTAEQIERFVADLVQSNEGARGFFVGYLTSNEAIADQLNTNVVKGLATHPAVVADLLVKNLAMSTAQKLHFLRDSQADMAANSAAVAARSAQLINALQLPECQAITQQLLAAIRTGMGDYADFLVRWGYDTEQKQAIEAVLLQTR